MNIILKSIKITNFKGIRSFQLTFDKETNILGANASGKTTIKDAFLWLFFGKDSTDRTDFEIKTLDENNKPYHNLSHEVEGVVDVDGQEINIRHTYREKWTKKRGSNTPVFDGHTHEYFWNDVPLAEKEFKVKVAAVIDEKLFKLLTSTEYFNSLKWQDRRNVLLSMAGTISNDDVFLSMKADVEELKKAFAQGKTIEEFKKEIAAKRKKIKDELDIIPTRIEEANRSLPELVYYDVIESTLVHLKEEIIGIDQLLNNKSAAVKEYQQTINNLLQLKQQKSRAVLDIESSTKNLVQEAGRKRAFEIAEQKTKLRSIADELNTTRNHYKNVETRIAQLTTEQNAVREAWHLINDSQLEAFNDDDFCCPACKRAFEAADIEAKKAELTANFNSNKSKKLTEKQQRGVELGKEIEMLKVELSNLKAKGTELSDNEQKQAKHIEQLEEQHNRMSADEAGEYSKSLIENITYNNLQEEIRNLDAQIEAPAPEQNNSALTQRKKDLQQQVDDLNRQLAGKEQRTKILARIEELKSQEETMAQEFTALDGIEYSIEQFTKAKMDTLEQRINGRFSMVRFQMFEDQINGGQADACITLVNSNGSYVPYADANTAAKIQAGLDIINTLSKHYGITAPVWVDNRESVTALPETDCQLINLIVSPKHKKLTVLNQLEEAAA